MITVKVGNLLSQQEAIVHFQLVQVLKLEVGSYCLKVPQSFFPSCKQDYLYNFTAEIFSDFSIVQVICPNNSKVHEKNVSRTHYSITKDPESGLDVTKDLVIYYRTNN